MRSGAIAPTQSPARTLAARGLTALTCASDRLTPRDERPNVDHPAVDSTSTVAESSDGQVLAWEFALAAGFAAGEARRSVFHRSGGSSDEPPTQNGARHACER